VLATGCSPPEEHTPSSEQLAALRAVLNSGRVPYVDFAVWGPYGARVARFRKTEAAVFVAGELVTKRVDGPSSFDAWLVSWELFAVAMVSLGAARVGTLARYRNGVQQLVKLFPKMWGILQTTDVIVRSERWGRLREQVENTKACGAETPGFDPEAPWDFIISSSSYGAEGGNAAWWQAHFVLPCTLSSSAPGASGMIRHLEGYPTGGGSSSASGSAPPPPSARQPPPKKQRTDVSREICGNYNKRVGRCAGEGPCPAGRRHTCDQCSADHRSCEHHWGKPSGGKDQNKNTYRQSKRR